MIKNSIPLAIVGMSCLFPKADGLQAYWANIKNGVDAITPIPVGTHWNAEDYFNADPKAPAGLARYAHELGHGHVRRLYGVLHGLSRFALGRCRSPVFHRAFVCHGAGWAHAGRA